MGCERIVIGNSYGWICSRGARRRTVCHICRGDASLLCDFPIGTQGRTCSRRLCRRCAVRRKEPGSAELVDYCPAHELPALPEPKRKRARARAAAPPKPAQLELW
jgi:hypothetical protein